MRAAWYAPGSLFLPHCSPETPGPQAQVLSPRKLWPCLTSLHLPEEPGLMVGDILPLLSLEKRNQRVKASGAPWEYPKEVANEARPVLSSERGSGEPQEQPCSVGRPESTVAFFRARGAAAHRHRAGGHFRCLCSLPTS